MHKKYEATISQIEAWARENRAIQAIVIIGSQARSTILADQWSDLDLMILFEDPQPFVMDSSWLSRFGEVACWIDEAVPLHFTGWKWYEKRVLYTDNRDIDFILLPYHFLDEVLAATQDILSKGFRVLYDAGAGQLEARISAHLQTVEKAPSQSFTEQEFQAVVGDLLFHVIWAFKKIKRNELWVAVNCINCYMKNLLLRLIEAYNAFTHPEQNLLPYNGRFLETRTDPEVLAQLAGCFTRYDTVEAVQTLQHLIQFSCTLAKAISERSGYSFDAALFENIQRMFDEMKEDTKIPVLIG